MGHKIRQCGEVALPHEKECQARIEEYPGQESWHLPCRKTCKMWCWLCVAFDTHHVELHVLPPIELENPGTGGIDPSYNNLSFFLEDQTLWPSFTEVEVVDL